MDKLQLSENYVEEFNNRQEALIRVFKRGFTLLLDSTSMKVRYPGSEDFEVKRTALYQHRRIKNALLAVITEQIADTKQQITKLFRCTEL
ncbi:hypothetical protein GF354_01915 [Candidatus Peregrinibacteria bacterium]|nr:hypothetical protein [Candidatus Peregrinibacteria bacterium]